MRFVYATGSRPLDGFTIKRGIGVGGFGEVYFAVSDAGKEVALKRIQRNMDIEIRGVSQCINLKHANLVSLYDIKYDDEGQAWVVMEYVRGETLKDVLERNPHGLPERQALNWLAGIAAGVGALHDHGIVHRDLKPGNVFLDQDVVKVGDYGLSKFISCSRRSGQTESVGTFHYMAPEIGKGSYGKEIDIYALGIILFELLTGRVPFEGESSQEIIMKHLTADPDLNGLPDRFQPVIRKALFKDPSKRFGSVQEMMAALAEVEAADPARRPQGIPPVRKPARAAAAAEPLYIGDSEESQGIFLGPLKEVVAAESVPGQSVAATPPEPIARAVHDSWSSAVSWWRNAHLSLPIKVLLLAGFAILLIVNSQWLIPAGIALGAIYLVYFGVRSLVLALQDTGRSPAQVAQGTTPFRQTSRPNPRRFVRWQDAARDSLQRKTASERLGELSGSLLLSAVVCVVTSLVMMMIGGKPLDGSVHTWTFFGWLAVTSTVGAWGVLAAAKWWEGTEGEQFRRRFVMLVGGLLLGAAAFSASEFLEVRLTDDLIVRSLPDVEIWASMYEVDGSPRLPAFMVYFAALFAILRLWLQADPLRTTRLSLWATGTCVLWAWILHLLWPIPQPWGFMLPATISIAVQLASPWVTPKQRSEYRRQAWEA